MVLKIFKKDKENVLYPFKLVISYSLHNGFKEYTKMHIPFIKVTINNILVIFCYIYDRTLQSRQQ